MGLCSVSGYNYACDAGKTSVRFITSGLASDAVSSIASYCQQAEVNILGTLMSLWEKIPTASSTNAVTFVRTYTNWLVGFLAVLGLLIAAGMMAWQRRGEPARAALSSLVTLVVVSGASVAFVELASASGDGYSNWILDRALHGTSFATEATNLVSLSTTTLTAMLMIVLGLFSIIACLVQIVLMLARVAMLGLLAGVLPLGAAISGTQEGKAWFRKMCAWLLAYLLYKPVAATIYAYSFVALKDDSDSVDQLSGLVMIILATVALPALMRFVTPMVSGAAGGGGSGAGAALAGAGVATGARILASRGSSGASNGSDPAGAGSPASAGSPTGSRGASGGGGGGIASPNGGPGHRGAVPGGAVPAAGSGIAATPAGGSEGTAASGLASGETGGTPSGAATGVAGGVASGAASGAAIAAQQVKGAVDQTVAISSDAGLQAMEGEPSGSK